MRQPGGLALNALVVTSTSCRHDNCCLFARHSHHLPSQQACWSGPVSVLHRASQPVMHQNSLNSFLNSTKPVKHQESHRVFPEKPHLAPLCHKIVLSEQAPLAAQKVTNRIFAIICNCSGEKIISMRCLVISKPAALQQWRTCRCRPRDHISVLSTILVVL